MEEVIKSEFHKKIEELSKREFVSEEEAVKHYSNLASFIGKKKEDYAKELEPKIQEMLTENEKKIKESYSKYENFIKEAGIDINTVNPLAIKEYVGEQHGDIRPRADANQDEAKKQDTRNKASRGNENAQLELARSLFK